MAELLQLRRAPAAQWTNYNTVLADGEPAVETDSGLMKVGDGVTAWTSLPYVTDRPNRGVALTGTAAFTGGTNWTVSSDTRLRRLGGGLASMLVSVTYTGTTAITVPTTGDIANQTVANLAATGFTLLEAAPLSSLKDGRGAFGYIGVAGNVVLSAISGTADLTNAAGAITLAGFVALA